MREINLSVIIPVYNAEAYIARCLESVFSQTLEGIEVICVNDGSTDGSLALLQQYQLKHDNLVILNQKNAGPSAARNAGMAVAKGKYIAFVDSDDHIEEDMYLSMLTVAEDNGLQVVLCSYLNDYADRPSEEAVFPLPGNTILGENEIANLIYPELMKDSIFNGPCNKIYQRHFINCLDIKMPENLRYGEDLIFQLEIFDKLERTYFIDKPFYHYVHRENSLSTVHKDIFESVLVPMYRVRQRYTAKWNLSEEKTAEYFVYYVLMDMVNSLYGIRLAEKVHKLRAYLCNSIFSHGLKISKFFAGDYTIKLKGLYVFCRLWRKR